MAGSNCCCRKTFARPGAALRSTPGVSSFIVPNGVYTLNVWVVGGGGGANQGYAVGAANGSGSGGSAGGTVTNSLGQGGKGGDSRYGFASASTVCFGGNVVTTPPSVGYGAGGSGALAVLIAQAGITGNNGQPGIVIITEFI